MFVRSKKQNGFSLIELIIVILIIAILAVLALPQVTAANRLWRFAGFQREMVSLLREARQEAVSERTTVTFQYDDAKKRVVLFGGGFGALGDSKNRVYYVPQGNSGNELVFGNVSNTPKALGDTTKITDLVNQIVNIKFQADGSVTDSSNNLQNNALFFFNVKMPNETASSVQVDEPKFGDITKPIICMSNNQNSLKNSQAGFSLLETIIALLIITIGLLGTVATVTYSLQMTTASRNIGTAKLMIISTFEEIETLRNDATLEFKQIGNVGNVDNTQTKYQFSGFSVGIQSVSMNPGRDRIYGTDDDLIDAGTDQVFGTADDFQNDSLIRSGYQREIIISPLPNQPEIKKVEVKIRYFSVGGSSQEVNGICYINDNYRVVIN
jgi:prepilin-type N-terminal cleavage/methylation domain-containing protein